MSKFILRGHNNGSFYNGGKGYWNFDDVDSPDEIMPEYIFNSEQEISELDMYKNSLKNWYDIVELDGLVLKPKCPYERGSPTNPKLAVGVRNELCWICATNILVGEKYLIWKDGKKYCLHCVMTQLDNLDSLIGSIPSELKKEWKEHGKVETLKCTDAILKEEVG
jgi:hypothetical protein